MFVGCLRASCPWSLQYVCQTHPWQNNVEACTCMCVLDRRLVLPLIQRTSPLQYGEVVLPDVQCQVNTAINGSYRLQAVAMRRQGTHPLATAVSNTFKVPADVGGLVGLVHASLPFAQHFPLPPPSRITTQTACISSERHATEVVCKSL